MEGINVKSKSLAPQGYFLVYLLHVDLVFEFTVEFRNSVSCDAMTKISSCLDENSRCR